MKKWHLVISVVFFISCKESKPIQSNSACTLPIATALQVTDGHVERMSNFHSQYVKARNIDIWLPKNYNSDIAHAVIYMHDGQMLFDSTTTWNKQEWKADETLQSLIDTEKVPPSIIVGIWNVDNQRHNNYFPEKAIDYFKGDVSTFSSNGLNADDYLKFITEELIPCIRTRYNVKTAKEFNVMSGSSMGGLISMYALCEYPDIFGGAACMSTHWPGVMPDKEMKMAEAIFNYLEDNIPSCKDHLLYFDYGNLTLDSLYVQFGNRVDQILSDNKCDASQALNIFYPEHDHSERSWQKRLHVPFEFLLSRNN